jgi:hypothetical protein
MRATRSKARAPKWSTFAPPQWQVLTPPLTHCSAMPCRVRDETYIKVKGKWAYYYRAIDKFGKTLDFML